MHDAPAPEWPLATRQFLASAARLGLEAEVLDEFGYLFELRAGGRRRVLLGGRSPLNDAVAARLAEDKHYTSVLLRRAGVAVPDTVRCLSPRHPSLVAYRAQAGPAPALRLLQTHPFPLVVKPNRLSHGRGVSAVSNLDELKEALEAVWELDGVALVQERIEGTDLRLDFLDGAYLAGYERRPVVLEGDGERTARELLHAAAERFADDAARLEGPLRAALARYGLEPDTILPEGRSVPLEPTILNLHRLALARILRDCPPEALAIAQEVEAAMGLRHFGLDLKAGPRGHTVLEVNASPLLGQIARLGFPEVADAAVDRLLEAIVEDLR
jgi:glutathione synthase/RimK-type ligase-like ATP-grasp enzyme